MLKFKTTDYTKYKEQQNFECAKLTKQDGKVYLNGEVVQETIADDKGRPKTITHYIGNHFLVIDDASPVKTLSPSSLILFKFRGKKVESLSAMLNAIKYKDKKYQNLELTDDMHTIYPNQPPQVDNFWGDNGCIYWQSKPILRHSPEYQQFLDELFVALLNNPLFRLALTSPQVKDKYLLCYTNSCDPHETLLTRQEYETRLNTLRDFYIKCENEYIQSKAKK